MDSIEISESRKIHVYHIVVSCGSVDVNDSRNSRNRTEDLWPKTRLILRSLRSTFDTDKKVNKNPDVTFGRNMKVWLYMHDAVVNSSCNFSKACGRMCYIYNCEKEKILYCKMELRTGPCPESLKAYENSFHCQDNKISRAKGLVHVCKLGGLVRSFGERSKLKNGKNACVHRDVMTLSGSIEELISRVDVKPWLVRKRRYFRREREDTTEAKQQDDNNLKTDKDEEDGKTDGTTKNSKEDNDNDSNDKRKREDNNEDGNDTSNSKSTTTASNADEEKPTGKTTKAGTKGDVTDENVTITRQEEMTSTSAVTESRRSEETATSDEREMTTNPAVTESRRSEETATSDEGEMTTTPAVTEFKGSEETTTSDEGKEMTTTRVVTVEMVTTSSKDDTVMTPKERNKGDSRIDDSSFKDTKEMYSLLSKLYREHSDFIMFQIKRQLEKRIKEGEISELLRWKMKTMMKNKGLSREAAMKKLKNEIREHLYGSKIMTMIRNILDGLGQALKIGKDGELSR